jgi:Zn-finger nucleic acid-binding protein
MIVVERRNIELDHCVNCKGLWFDAGELALLSEALDLEVEMPDIASLPKVDVSEKPRKCPRCRKAMDKIYIGGERGVLIDRCVNSDGLWFDWGELGQVLERLAKKPESGEGEIIKFLGETIRH